MNTNDYMLIAINEAKKAYKKNEIPIGAVVVKNGKVVSKAFNCREKKQNAIFHAETLAIFKACKKLKSWRLDDCDIYVTLEPCLMCFGAILNARIKNVYFGASATESNGFLNNIKDLNSAILNHKPNIVGGIEKEKCEELIKNFFKEKTRKK
ncbi:MAG: nucleoside deaminase [Clostridia bacterium]|nr:nucleoside deaminase [Clostridia bacterium]